MMMATTRLFFLQGWATWSQIFQRFLFHFQHHKNWIFRRVYQTMCYPSGCWTFQTQQLKTLFRILHVVLGLLSMFSCFCFSSPCSVFHVVSHLWHLGFSGEPCNHTHIVQIKRLPVRKRDRNIHTNPASYPQNLGKNWAPRLLTVLTAAGLFPPGAENQIAKRCWLNWWSLSCSTMLANTWSSDPNNITYISYWLIFKISQMPKYWLLNFQ